MAWNTLDGKIRLLSFLKGTHMPMDKEKLKENLSLRAHELIQLTKDRNVRGTGEVMSGTISILETLYGANSEKVKAYIHFCQYCEQRKDSYTFREERINEHTRGVLKSIESELEMGLVGNLELQAQGGIFGDFVTLARESLDESKDVAAVLVSAALEDALKRFASQNNLDVSDANMEQVINALTSKGLLKGPQAAIVKGHKQLRTKAFHANWDKIDRTSVSSAIGFTESFILENFS